MYVLNFTKTKKERENGESKCITSPSSNWLLRSSWRGNIIQRNLKNRRWDWNLEPYLLHDGVLRSSSWRFPATRPGAEAEVSGAGGPIRGDRRRTFSKMWEPRAVNYIRGRGLERSGGDIEIWRPGERHVTFRFQIVRAKGIGRLPAFLFLITRLPSTDS